MGDIAEPGFHVSQLGCHAYKEQGAKQAHNLKSLFFQSVLMHLSQALTANHSTTSPLRGGADLTGAERTCGG